MDRKMRHSYEGLAERGQAEGSDAAAFCSRDAVETVVIGVSLSAEQTRRAENALFCA